MMGDRQSQKGGDSSTNIQAHSISVGLSYAEARQVAMDVFRDNFLKLKSEAAQIAQERAETLLDTYLKRAAQEGKTEIPEAENPDFQMALFSAQRDYARTGDEDLGKLLVQLLVDRTKLDERNLIQIVLNQSLTVAPMLTSDQLNALSLIFLLRYTVNNGLIVTNLLGLYLDQLILPFVPGASRKESAYQHLEYAGCGSISMGQLQLEEAFRRNYPGLLSKGFAEEAIQDLELTPEARAQLIIPNLHGGSLVQVKALNDQQIDNLCAQLEVEPEKVERLKQLQAAGVMPGPEVKDFLVDLRPQMARLFDVWNDTSMKHMTLTSVGIAIAHANIKRQTGASFDLSIWI